MSIDSWIADPTNRADFPAVNAANTERTSSADVFYNCFAWAMGEDDRLWDPDQMDVAYWPDGATRSFTREAFVEAFGTRGYVEMPGGDFALVDGLEKVVIYLDALGIPTHAARQLPSGRWASKIGQNIDVEHELAALEGGLYGRACVVLGRSRSR